MDEDCRPKVRDSQTAAAAVTAASTKPITAWVLTKFQPLSEVTVPNAADSAATATADATTENQPAKAAVSQNDFRRPKIRAFRRTIS